MELGQRIKQLRLSLGLTQEELGAKVNVTKATINKYETGVIVYLKRPMLDKLSKALAVSPAYLMGWEETPSEEESELIRIFHSLNVRHRAELLAFAINMEAEENK